MTDAVLFDRLNDDVALTALVGSRVYPGLVPMGESLPAIAYTPISRPRTVAFGADTGPEQPRFQIDVIDADTELGGSGYDGAREVRAHVVRLLNRWQDTPAGVLVADSHLIDDAYTYDQKSKRHRWRLDFQVFVTEYSPLLFEAAFNAHLATFTRTGSATYNDK
jgi:hypothetical protein